MAFSFHSPAGGRRGRFRGASMSEMNVVPLVDVVLVLLIIFMVTAQVMEFGLEIDVPTVRQEKQSAQELPVISISQRGEVYLNDRPININEIASQVRSRFPGQNAVYLRADKRLIWDVAVQVISALDAAKLQARVVTKSEEIAEPAR